jgi:hypothetical protein
MLHLRRKGTWLSFHWCGASRISGTERFDWLAGNRTITYSGTSENHISFKFKEGPDPHFPTVFNREMNVRDIKLKMVCFCFTGSHKSRSTHLIFQAAGARVLHPILVEELSFQKHPDLIRRRREVEYRVTCGGPNDFWSRQLGIDSGQIFV